MKYLSGWEALNIPTENGETADWHPNLYFNKDVKFYDTLDFDLGNIGIKYRYVKALNGYFYVASFARAIADLVFLNQMNDLKNCVNDFLNDEEEVELYNYLKNINKNKNVENFIKFELTKFYFGVNNA